MTEWTLESLRTYFERVVVELDRRYEQRFTAEAKAVASAMTAAQTAIDKAEANALTWRENANEWRAAMTDREKRFATRSEVDDLKKFRDMTVGTSAGRSDMWGYVVGAIGAVVGVVGMILALAR